MTRDEVSILPVHTSTCHTQLYTLVKLKQVDGCHCNADSQYDCSSGGFARFDVQERAQG